MPFINDVLAESGRLPPGARPRTEPTTNKTSRFRFEPADVMRTLRARIVGQDHVLSSIESALKLVKVDIGAPDRPLYVALLLGPTGVGKTEVVRALAEAIHGGADAFCRIDMNTLAQEHYGAALTGAPPGYVGSKEGTTLLDDSLIEGSYSAPGIVLFDEIEKASTEVTRSLLGVLDDGRLTLTAGSKTLNFRNSLIFMTSNLAAKEIQNDRSRRRAGLRGWLPAIPGRRRRRLRDIVENALTDAFDPEFINRIDEITIFNWLEGHVLDRLVEIQMDMLNRRLARLGYRAELDAGARRLVRRQGADARYGARAMRRAFRRHVEIALADALAEVDLRKRDPDDIQVLHGTIGSDRQIIFEHDPASGRARSSSAAATP